MEKKLECEIVQDLLIGYEDGILSQESKKLVESHLLKCKKCQEKLEEIKSETEKDESQQKKEIDYLKKIRRKSRMKSVLLAFLILGAMFSGMYLYKFCVIHGIVKKIEKQFEGENFYIESISNTSENSLMISKTWYKEGKYKVVMYEEKEDETKQMFETRYGNMKENAKEEYWINEEEKKVRKEKFSIEKSKSEFICQQSPFILKSARLYGLQYIRLKLGEPFYVKISTDHKEIGRKYYVLDFGETKKWVDIDTGLPIMSFGDVLSTTFYKNTKIPKEQFESISQYHYEFGKVTDEDVEIPDFKGYELREFDWGEEINRLLEEQNNEEKEQ